jgi:hypothetical protein
MRGRPTLLPDNAVFNARVEAVLAIIETGKIGQTEAIEKIFRCTRSSKSDSVYARARAAIGARQQPTHKYRELDEYKQPVMS